MKHFNHCLFGVFLMLYAISIHFGVVHQPLWLECFLGIVGMLNTIPFMVYAIRLYRVPIEDEEAYYE